jgi:hypothetical protein
MPGPSLALRSLAGWLALCVLVSVPASGGAQALSEDAVKAGFVFNFLKFTQWPPARDPHPLSLRICTTAARALDGQMALLQGRTLGERVIEVRSQVGPDQWRSCGLLFVSAADADRVQTALSALAQVPVLTVSDQPGFAPAGGMIGLRTEGGRVRFDVNLAAAQRAGLAFNAQMLTLAGQVMR